MKGWQFVETNEPLELIEKEDPKVESGKVVIDMKVAGLCHSDVGVMRDPGWKALLGELPVIMGHEVTGVISDIRRCSDGKSNILRPFAYIVNFIG